MKPANFPSEWVWWYGVAGGLAWLAVIFVWRHTGDFEGAADLICRGAAGLGWWLGYLITGFWLASFALSCALLVPVVSLLAVGRTIDRRRARGRRVP
jgi:hypothetical protein